MAETNPQTSLWLRRALFAGLALLIMFGQLLPLPVRPERWPGPDLLVALTFAWAFRRPEYVPAFVVAAVFLLADLLFLKPPGLWAAVMVVATEFVKLRGQVMRDLPFPMEWATVASVLVFATLIDRLILSMMLVDQVPLGTTLIQVVMTLVAYPLVAAASHFGLGVRKAAPGEVDALGHKL